MIEEKTTLCPVCGTILNTNYHDDIMFASCPTEDCIGHKAGEQPLETWLNRPVEEIMRNRILMLNARVDQFKETFGKLAAQVEIALDFLRKNQ